MDTLCRYCHGLFRQIFGNRMKDNLFVLSMRIFVCFLNICPLYVVNQEMIEWMTNDTDRIIYKMMLNFSIAGALLSYWTASLRKPKPIP